ncbi:molybdenum cofactor guanylyltransferase [Lujinxingia litoralis]|uniref:molybdenum cofactor guanylyltransferase n=1 Tax=Lujinxingia litoralis TaxID=2211119 RepID=UPI001314E8FD|nr:molybdenum cofactor guanylyltransferase [Lujinxingia litoralis]
MRECRGYVLAGGLARRLGQDKARAEIAPGVALINWVCGRLSPPITSWTAVGARAGQFEDLGVPTLGDRWPGQGPLGGIATAANEAQAGWFFVTSCDAAWARGRWVELLWEQRQGPAVVFEHEGIVEPLFGWYRGELAEPLAQALEAGHRSVWRFLNEVGATRVAAPRGWVSGQGINDPQDLTRAQTFAQKILRADR